MSLKDMASSNYPEPSSSEHETEVPEWKLSREGITLIINDKGAEAERLFLQYPDSLVMYSGYAFALMMDALMSFEEEKLNKAISTLRDVEKRCTLDTGWLKSVTQKVFGSNTTAKPMKSYAEQLETQIILADSQVCIAILSFLQQDITGYFKGSWVLRKAWKIYNRLYNEILDLYKENVGEFLLNNPDSNITALARQPQSSETSNIGNGYLQSSSIPHSKSLHSYDYSRISEREALTKSLSINNALSASWKSGHNSIVNSISSYSFSMIFSSKESKAKPIEKDVIIRLMGAVSFGYGLFQLGVSLLPPSLIRLINLFGFTTDRENGIACLMYARTGTDMRAPLATLCLLWYHTIVRPFYAIDGTNVQAGVASSFSLIKESEREFGTSSLILFFQGRAYRLDSNIREALKSFQQAASNSDQREMKTLCMHEIAWCYLIELDYEHSLNTLTFLKSSSRWSKGFYCYLAAICAGSCENMSNPSLFHDLKRLTDSMPKGAQLDEFLTRRCKLCPSDLDSIKTKRAVYWNLLVFEMLYLWNALPSCSTQNILKIIYACRSVKSEEDEPMRGLHQLILGCCYCVQKQHDEALLSLRKCLDLRKNIPPNSEDAHVSAFCQFELASILIRNPETKAEGKSLLEQMSQYSQYDFEQKLNVRVHSTLKQC